MYTGLHVKCPLFLSDFNETSNFSSDFRNIFEYHTSRKAVQLEPSCSIGRTDKPDEANSHVSQMANAPKNRPKIVNCSVKLQLFTVLKF